MIEVKNLTKQYGNKLAVDNVSFTVQKGEILGFLGPNGAGKSTTMNILTGYLSATDGSVKIGEYDVLDNPIEAKSKMGYLPEQPPLYLDMTVMEYLNFVYDIKKVKIPRKAHLAEVCDTVKISDVNKRIIKNLSKGYRQRVGLAAAIIGNPDVLVLDEPTVGLDPKQIIEIRNLIKNFSHKHTVILSSHILSEVQAICDKVIIINKGKLIANDTADNLASKLSSDKRYSIRIDGPEAEVLKILHGLSHIVEIVPLGKRDNGVYEYTIEGEEGFDFRKELFFRLAERKWPILSLKSHELTLEDIFLQLVSGEYQGDAFGDLGVGDTDAEEAIELDLTQNDDTQASTGDQGGEE